MGNDLSLTIEKLLSTPEFVQSLGWTIALAIVIGGVLNDGYKQLLSWICATVLFVLLLEMNRAAYFSVTDNPIIVPNILALITTIDFISGLTIGWFISYFAKKRVYNQHAKDILRRE